MFYIGELDLDVCFQKIDLLYWLVIEGLFSQD